MPRVPETEYVGYPTQVDQESPAPMLHINAPPDAFGVNIGRAMESLGEGIQQDSDKLANRASALQQMKLEADANSRASQAAKESGIEDANFKQLKGANAGPDALKEHYDKLDAIRKKYGEGLPPAGYKIYDSESRSFYNRSLFSGAAHSGEQLDKYSTDALKAQQKASVDSSLMAPTWEDFKKQLEISAESSTAKDSQYFGASPEVRQLAKADLKSSTTIDYIHQMAEQHPVEAMKMYKEAKSSGLIQGEKVGQLYSYVSQQVLHTYSRGISDKVNTGRDLYWGTKPVSIERAQDAIGGFESGHNYSEIGVETKGGHAVGRYQVMSNLLPEYLKAAGMAPMSEKEFIKNHDAQDMLFKNIFGGYMEKYGSFNDAAVKWFTGKSLSEGGFSAGRDAIGTSPYKYLQGTNAILARSVGIQDKVARGEELMTQLMPDDDRAPFAVRDRIETDEHRSVAEQNREMQTNFYSLRDTIAGAGDPTKKVTSQDQIFNNPQLAEAYSRLNPQYKARVDHQIQANAKEPVHDTPERAIYANKIMDMSVARNGKIPQFLEYDAGKDLVDGKISLSGYQKIESAQRQVQKGLYKDSERLEHAMTISKDRLVAAGIIAGSDDHISFTAQMNQFLKEQESQKKFTSDKDIMDQAARMTGTVGSRWNPFSQMEYEPTKDFVKKFTTVFKKDPRSQGREPSVEQIGRAWQYSKDHPDWEKE